MNPHRVVEPLKLFERLAQTFLGSWPDLFKQWFQSAEQPLYPCVVPRTIRHTAPMANPQTCQNRAPQGALKHAFVIGTNRRGHAKSGHRQKQVPQQRQSAFARQVFEAQQTPRAVVDDAQHRMERALGAGAETQIQRPSVIDRKSHRWLASHGAALIGNLQRMGLEYLSHPGLTDSDPAAQAPVEVSGDLAATEIMHGQMDNRTPDPQGLALRTSVGQWLSRRKMLGPPPKDRNTRPALLPAPMQPRQRISGQQYIQK